MFQRVFDERLQQKAVALKEGADVPLEQHARAVDPLGHDTLGDWALDAIGYLATRYDFELIGTVIPGIPARFAGTVNTSARYMWYGSFVRSPNRNAGAGVVGVKSRSTPVANTPSKSAVIRALTYRPELFGTAYNEWIQTIMRGDSGWSVGERELFATFTSRTNQCPF